MNGPPPTRRGPGSRTLVLVLVLGAILAVALPTIFARSRTARTMRVDLTEVVGECRELYAKAPTAADTAAVDSVRPLLHGRERPGDPACGHYRRRNMTRPLGR
ncbi:MAG TPA: hypothetical protein VF046_07355 [Gemmatimonadales bacterium]